jgi:hypothetical protein
MWRKLKSLLVMDAPEWWDQPLEEFMAEQAALAEARAVSHPPAASKAEATLQGLTAPVV